MRPSLLESSPIARISRHLTSRSTRRLTRVMASGAVILATSSHALAESRDADGSRLQARSMSVGGTERDSLMPPRDRVDWRSFKLESQATVSVSVSHKPSEAAVQLSLTDARGKSLASASSKSGSASLRQSLEPGIYYVSVSASDKVTYSLTVK